MKKLLFIFISMLFITSFAYAAPHGKGFYAEGNIGASLYSRVIEWHYSERTAVGSNVNLGYLFNRYIATEIGYTRYNLGGNTPNSVDLAAKFIYPLVNHDLNIFAKIGPTYLFATGSQVSTSVGALLGVGAAYQVTPKVDLNVQAQDSLVPFDNNRTILYSAGLTYHFDI